jgi:PAS domain S-box-containing protein
MRKNDNYAKGPVYLRQRAEELLKKRNSGQDSQFSEADSLKLIHELEVHKIELEMQNDELMLSRSAAYESVEKYTELYDFSPAGYFTLSREGEIIELNLSGSQMLGKERSYLKGIHFGSFVSGDAKASFSLFLTKIFNSHVKESCELSLLIGDIAQMYVHLTGLVTSDGNQCLVNAIDITGLRQAET